jgi:hypothetical protein
MRSFRERLLQLSRVPSLYPGGREQFVQIGVKSCVIQGRPPPTAGSRFNDPGVRRVPRRQYQRYVMTKCSGVRRT